jgi:hypothetical protein
MAKIKTTFLTIMMLSLPAVLLSANDVFISEISLSGLKRTKEDVVYKILEPLEVGSRFTAETEQIIVQKLRETGIFVPDIGIKTDIIDNEAFISIEISDRWTFIPIPIFTISGESEWNAGVLAIENNFLGFYKTLGLGFFYGSGGWTLISFYSDPLFFQKDIKFTAAFAAGYDQIEDLDVYGTTIREYEADKVGASLELEFPLTETFSLSGEVEYDSSFLRDESAESSDFSDMNTLGVNGTILWENIFYDIPYEKGVSLSLSPSWNFGFQETGDFFAVEGNFFAAFSPWLNHLLEFDVLGGWGDLPVQKQFRLGGMTGTRILPMGGIAADEYLTSAILYNIPLWSFKGGTISSKIFYEAGYYKSDLTERTFFHGPGMGLEFFINNLAIPAVGINLGWNLETEEMQFSAGIGM